MQYEHIAVDANCNAMKITNNIELKNLDIEGVNDILEKIEKFFDFKFGKNELEHVTTFGELCDIITSKVQGENEADCTTQQAFYKIRRALITSLDLEPEYIKTETTLLELFPKQDRKQRLKEFEEELD